MPNRDPLIRWQLRLAMRLCICAAALAFSPFAAAQEKPSLLFIGMFRNGTADERIEAVVQQHLGDIGHPVRRPPAIGNKCMSAECLTEYPSRKRDEFVLTGTFNRTDSACNGVMFLSFANDQPPLSRPFECHISWSEPELYQRIADTAGSLADQGQRSKLAMIEEQKAAAKAAAAKVIWPWTWKRKLAVGVIGIALAGTAAGLGVAAGMNGRPNCVGEVECATFTVVRQGMIFDPITTTASAQILEIHPSIIPILGCAVGLETAGLIVSLTLP